MIIYFLICLILFTSTQPKSNFLLKLILLLLLLLSRFSCVRLCATPKTAAHQAPPSLVFSRQEHWSGLPLPSPSVRLGVVLFDSRAKGITALRSKFPFLVSSDYLTLFCGKLCLSDFKRGRLRRRDVKPRFYCFAL